MKTSGAHDESHEQRLLDHLLGEGSVDEALIEACEECAARRTDLAPLVETLLAEGYQERQDVYREAAETPSEINEELSMSSFLSELEKMKTTEKRSSRLFVWIAAAAAVVVLLFALQLEEESAAPFFLGTGGLDLDMQPQGVVDGADEFTWRDVVPDGSYTLEVYRLDLPNDLPLVRVQGLEDASWEPDRVTLEALDAGIRWEVFVYDELNELEGSGWAKSRSSH